MVLLKFVLSSLPVYALSFFRAPSGIISSIGAEKNPLVSWSDVCLIEEASGLRVRQLREFNTALLGKWCLRMLVDKPGLWYRVLAAWYGEEVGRVKEGCQGSSSWWREITRIRNGEGLVKGWFDEGVEWRVGNGLETSFWSDLWVGEASLSVRFPRLYPWHCTGHVRLRL
jgi:hypothetical protein